MLRVPQRPFQRNPVTPPPRRHPDVELLGSELLHEGRIFRLLRESARLPSGLRQDVDVVDHPGAVAIAALDAEGRLLLVRQYRHALGEWLVELPAGRREEGEEPLEAARRELEEETGHRAARWTHLREIVPAPGFCSERIQLFLAEDLEAVPGGGLDQDDDEELELLRRTPAELLAGDWTDGKTLVAAALLATGAARGRETS